MRRAVAAACIVLGAAAVGAGAMLATTARTVHAKPVPVVDVGRLPLTRPAPRSAGPVARVGLPAGSRLRLLGTSAPIERIDLVGHALQIPGDPRRVGWWVASSGPGSGVGTTVIVGHVNYAGVTGALAGIASLRPGATVRIVEPARTVRYRVDAVRTYPKTTGIPAATFARVGPPRLVLITCGGPFDPSTGNYLDNIVAYAVPV